MRGKLSLKKKDPSTGPRTTGGNQSKRNDQHLCDGVCLIRGLLAGAPFIRCSPFFPYCPTSKSFVAAEDPFKKTSSLYLTGSHPSGFERHVYTPERC
jgi:hypothetical protein